MLQAKSDAAVSEAAEKQKTSEAEASYANSLASQAAAQNNKIKLLWQLPAQVPLRVSQH